MAWLQIKLTTTKDLVEDYSALLLATGALAVTVHGKNQPSIIEPMPGTSPLWEHLEIIGLYEQSVDIDTIKQQLCKHFGKKISMQIEPLAEQDWHQAWKENLHPLQFSNNLWVCPSWCNIPDPNACNIILDPGMAFGTGTHPTTALCLEWLATNSIQNSSVLDFGCGSGILGIAAAKLGASVVHCVDCDFQALVSTRDNAKKNSIAAKQLFTLLPQELPANYQATTVIANILANPLHELAETLANYVKPGGNIVLSGILIPQVEDLIITYGTWFDSLTTITKEEWARISGIKKCN